LISGEQSVSYGPVAGAFAAGWVAASALWIAIARFVWRTFAEPRIKELEETAAAEQAECKLRMERMEGDHRAEMQAMQARVTQLETVLWAKAGGALMPGGGWRLGTTSDTPDE
jgi:hypothetical protein